MRLGQHVMALVFALFVESLVFMASRLLLAPHLQNLTNHLFALIVQQFTGLYEIMDHFWYNDNVSSEPGTLGLDPLLCSLTSVATSSRKPDSTYDSKKLDILCMSRQSSRAEDPT